MNNAWIKIGRGERIIYLKKDNDIIFYRCGRHEIEDKVGRTSNSNLLTEINEITNIDIIDEDFVEMVSPNTFLKMTNRKLIDRLLSRIRLPHNEVFIVSPFIEIEYLKRQHKFRRMLENFMIEGSDVYILTQIPNEEDIEVFKDFERSTKVVLYFKERLHSKMYLFISNPNIKLSSFYKNHDLGIIGSANLTSLAFL